MIAAFPGRRALDRAYRRALARGTRSARRRLFPANSNASEPAREAELNDDDRIPTLETYRGVGIHAFQSAEQIATIVRPAIDRVHGLTDAASLTAYVEDPSRPPEGRLFAAAHVEALWRFAAENRELRPKIKLMILAAHTAGLNSLRWMASQHCDNSPP